MAKTLCDWSKKEIERHPDKLRELVDDPTFYCRKCARVANSPKVLCGAKRFGPREIDVKIRLAGIAAKSA